MNYHCAPDIGRDVELTPGVVALFQRFRQKRDVAAVNETFERELLCHLKLCELAILHAASLDIYWCEFPRHPIEDIEHRASRHLGDLGFRIVHDIEGSKTTVPCSENHNKTIRAVVVRSRWTITWSAQAGSRTAVGAEWRRREKLEQADHRRNPPQRQSKGFGTSLDRRKAVWATSLRGNVVAEVQRRKHGYYLCLFDEHGRCVHAETAAASFGALFGPDIEDTLEWSARAKRILEVELRANRPQAKPRRRE